MEMADSPPATRLRLGLGMERRWEGRVALEESEQVIGG